VDETCILVLKNCGPKGYPGMAEVGNMPLPPKVLSKGITDMVRISDARMSGTAYGTVVLHTAPEAAAGGPLAMVQNGDMIELNVPARRLHLLISDEELQARLAKHGRPRRLPCRRATGSCTSTMCCRPTRAPTWTFWSASAVPSCPRTITDHRRPRRCAHRLPEPCGQRLVGRSPAGPVAGRGRGLSRSAAGGRRAHRPVLRHPRAGGPRVWLPAARLGRRPHDAAVV
jgi:hypothetical protein